MKKGLTELVFILDRSGSMAGLESDTIGGFNSMLKKQQDKCKRCSKRKSNNQKKTHSIKSRSFFVLFSVFFVVTLI